MGLQRTLDAIATRLERATSVPLSASCLVNRGELLSLVERARAELPEEVDEADGVLAHRDELLDDAQRDALALVDSARQQAGRLVASHAIVTVAQRRADRILDAARAEAARLLRDADDYCDRRLAELETDLDAALGQVRRGRQRLEERSGAERSVAHEPPPDPEGDDLYDGLADEPEVPAAAPAAEPAAEREGRPPAERLVLDVAGLEKASAAADQPIG